MLLNKEIVEDGKTNSAA